MDQETQTTETPKKTRKRSFENQALTVAKVFRKSKEKRAAEMARHEARLEELDSEDTSNLALRDALDPKARTTFDRLTKEEPAETTEETP